MNSRFKFRVWDIPTKTFWKTNDGLNFFPRNIGLTRNSSGINELIILGEKFVIVQQFTGLKDKNGKEIYEGDIVEAYKCISTISFENAAFCAGHPWGNFPIGYESKMIDYSECDIFESNWNKHAKIIGNIFENPELLEKIDS